jgi:hypothetical protein
MSYTIHFLLSAEAAEGRKARKDGYRAQPELIGGAMGHVVHVETTEGFIELDATTEAHARDMMGHWLRHGSKVRTAAIRSVKADGSLSNIIGRVYDTADFEPEYR